MQKQYIMKLVVLQRSLHIPPDLYQNIHQNGAPMVSNYVVHTSHSLTTQSRVMYVSSTCRMYTMCTESHYLLPMSGSRLISPGCVYDPPWAPPSALVGARQRNRHSSLKGDRQAAVVSTRGTRRSSIARIVAIPKSRCPA